MKGNVKGMVLKKGDQQQVQFDLIIPTHKGVTFAMYTNGEGQIWKKLQELEPPRISD
jgi:hypothetical protein